MIFFSLGIFVSAFVRSDKEIRLNRMGKFPGLFMQLDRDGFFLKFFPDTLHFIFCGCLPDTHVVPIHPTDDKIYGNDYKYGNDNFYNCIPPCGKIEYQPLAVWLEGLGAAWQALHLESFAALA